MRYVKNLFDKTNFEKKNLEREVIYLILKRKYQKMKLYYFLYLLS